MYTQAFRNASLARVTIRQMYIRHCILKTNLYSNYASLRFLRLKYFRMPLKLSFFVKSAFANVWLIDRVMDIVKLCQSSRTHSLFPSSALIRLSILFAYQSVCWVVELVSAMSRARRSQYRIDFLAHERRRDSLYGLRDHFYKPRLAFTIIACRFSKMKAREKRSSQRV